MLLLVLIVAAFGYAVIAGTRLAHFRQCRAVAVGPWGIALTLPERPERPVVVAASDVAGARIRPGRGFRLGQGPGRARNRPWPWSPAYVLDVVVRDDRAHLDDPAIDLLRDESGEPGVWSYPLVGFRTREVAELMSRHGVPWLTAERTEPALRRLRSELADGTWRCRHGELLERSSLDVGYRLVVGERSR